MSFFIRQFVSINFVRDNWYADSNDYIITGMPLISIILMDNKKIT